jgi:hypothetical protein
MRSRVPAKRPQAGSDDRFARKQQPIATGSDVANQQPEAVRKQQRGVSRQPRAVRLSHHPGDAAVRRVRRDARVRGNAILREDGARQVLSNRSACAC